MSYLHVVHTNRIVSIIDLDIYRQEDVICFNEKSAVRLMLKKSEELQGEGYQIHETRSQFVLLAKGECDSKAIIVRDQAKCLFRQLIQSSGDVSLGEFEYLVAKSALELIAERYKEFPNKNKIGIMWMSQISFEKLKEAVHKKSLIWEGDKHNLWKIFQCFGVLRRLDRREYECVRGLQKELFTPHTGRPRYFFNELHDSNLSGQQ